MLLSPGTQTASRPRQHPRLTPCATGTAAAPHTRWRRCPRGLASSPGAEFGKNAPDALPTSNPSTQADIPRPRPTTVSPVRVVEPSPPFSPVAGASQRPSLSFSLPSPRAIQTFVTSKWQRGLRRARRMGLWTRKYQAEQRGRATWPACLSCSDRCVPVSPRANHSAVRRPQAEKTAGYRVFGVRAYGAAAHRWR